MQLHARMTHLYEWIFYSNTLPYTYIEDYSSHRCSCFSYGSILRTMTRIYFFVYNRFLERWTTIRFVDVTSIHGYGVNAVNAGKTRSHCRRRCTRFASDGHFPPSEEDQYGAFKRKTAGCLRFGSDRT